MQIPFSTAEQRCEDEVQQGTLSSIGTLSLALRCREPDGFSIRHGNHVMFEAITSPSTPTLCKHLVARGQRVDVGERVSQR